MARAHLAAGRALVVGMPGGYDTPRQLMGDERACVAFLDQPELIHDILGTLGDTVVRVLEQVCQRCGITPELHHANVELHGNTGGASAPSVLSMEWEKWRPEDDVAVSVVGGGLTWARALFRFGEAK